MYICALCSNAESQCQRPSAEKKTAFQRERGKLYLSRTVVSETFPNSDIEKWFVFLEVTQLFSFLAKKFLFSAPRGIFLPQPPPWTGYGILFKQFYEQRRFIPYYFSPFASLPSMPDSLIRLPSLCLVLQRALHGQNHKEFNKNPRRCVRPPMWTYMM